MNIRSKNIRSASTIVAIFTAYVNVRIIVLSSVSVVQCAATEYNKRMIANIIGLFKGIQIGRLDKGVWYRMRWFPEDGEMFYGEWHKLDKVPMIRVRHAKV